MAQTLIDIYQNILSYDNTNISIVIDSSNIPWFSATNIAEILEYQNTSKAISDHVKNEDIIEFEKLRKYFEKVPHNAQPHALYINESGLYSLIFSSKKTKAIEFTRWVTTEVLPSIRTRGYYIMEQVYKGKISKLNKKLTKYQNRVKVLECNQKKTKYGEGGTVYAIRSRDTSSKLIRIGKTADMCKRIPGYDTAMPNKFEVLYTLQVDNPIGVELCIRGLLHPNIYRRNKDYYRCTLEKIKEVFHTCDKLVKGEFSCQICGEKMNEMSRLIVHSKEVHNIDDNELLLVDLSDNQYGGSFAEIVNDNVFDDENYRKYIKYKMKYLSLKSTD